MSAVEGPSRSLADIGRDAARAAQRAALLATLEACEWNMSKAARRLKLGAARNALRSIRSLGLADEYEAAKAHGLITRGPRPRKLVSPLTQNSGQDTVRE